jgi:hypothetical protein
MYHYYSYSGLVGATVRGKPNQFGLDVSYDNSLGGTRTYTWYKMRPHTGRRLKDVCVVQEKGNLEIGCESSCESRFETVRGQPELWKVTVKTQRMSEVHMLFFSNKGANNCPSSSAKWGRSAQARQHHAHTTDSEASFPSKFWPVGAFLRNITEGSWVERKRGRPRWKRLREKGLFLRPRIQAVCFLPNRGSSCPFLYLLDLDQPRHCRVDGG